MIVPLVALLIAQAAIFPTPPPQPLRQNQAPVKAAPAPVSVPPVANIDRLFAVAAMQGNNAELDLARLALQRSSTPEVTGFAQKMITEHLVMADDMLPAIERLLVGIHPDRLSAADRLAYEHLRTVSPVDFDQGYLMGQIGDHLATMMVVQTEADNGTQPQLRALARKWLPTIMAHLDLAVTLTRHIGGASPFKQ